MNLILKNYQKRAIDNLSKIFIENLKDNSSQRVIFKSPTGSGKTLMVAEFIRNVFNKNKNCSVIWTAPRQLHVQSKNKIAKIFKDQNVGKTFEVYQLKDAKLKNKEMLFLNWESINKHSNVFIQENERNINLKNLIKNTKHSNVKIILIIDECHFSAPSQISNYLISLIDPDFTVGLSATPTLKDPDAIVKINIQDVKNEGMIKKNVIPNPMFSNKKDLFKFDLKEGSNIFFLNEAIKKRKNLLNQYKKINANINPLILIQLPDKKSHLEEELKNLLIRYLHKKHNINFKNRKLAIRLSNHKENLPNLEKNNNETEILIFKHAIALGWDCPRAQILVLLREWKSFNFSIQTLGRLLRMPLPKIGHFKNEDLNNAYIYTNLRQISLEDDVTKDLLITKCSVKSMKSNLSIKSIYIKRQRQKTRLTDIFKEILFKISKEKRLHEKIKIKKNLTINHKFITDEIQDIDKIKNKIIKSNFKIEFISNVEWQDLFENFIIHNLNPFYPEERSITVVKKTFYEYFDSFFKLNIKDNYTLIISNILSSDNLNIFKSLLDETKEKYQTKTSKIEKEIINQNNWDIPDQIFFNSLSHEASYKKSIMKPFVYSKISNPELKFMNYLDKSKKVAWWFKNGEGDSKYFAVPYANNGEKNIFFVDFIVKFKNGKLGFFDTKLGFTLILAKNKIKGLEKFVNTNKKNYLGGLISNSKVNCDGRWLINPGDLPIEPTSNWKNFLI